MTNAPSYRLPARLHNARGEVRTVGLELEIGGLSLEQTLALIQAELGGTLVTASRTEGAVQASALGTFKVEWDHSMLRQRSYLRPLERLGLLDGEHSSFADKVEDSVLQLAAEIVPIEVVTPPIALDQLGRLDPLWTRLRVAGAKDTHDSLLYAFGLHLNPEIPDRDSRTVLAYLRAFLLLEDFLVEVSKIDLARRISPFIKPFPEVYRRKVLALDYAPSAEVLLADYLDHSPTRNRTLDMLPLFVDLHGDDFLARVEEAPLVKGRPTFHYRLPNCALSEPGWTPAVDWNHWVAVEDLACDPARLEELSRAYLDTLDLPLRLQSGAWVDEVRSRLALPA